ncbi:MAG: ketopantoate reductase family protein [Candidatus Lokiarchaeota archaeon]|nr:ketopantoate reductase family protein [Candidatus Lokiarchaeota archaeon]
MKILVYGAGVIGSIFSYKLKNAGHDVSLLARGERFQYLKENGLNLRDDIAHEKYHIQIDVVEALDLKDNYDLILVIMQRQQVSQVLPVLQKISKVPTIVFIGNNAVGANEYLQQIDNEKILLGFGGPGGYREDGVVVGAYLDKAILYVGEINGSRSERLEVIKKEFTRAGIEVDLVKNIDMWLKTHISIISPLAMGSYAAFKRQIKFWQDKQLINLVIDSMRENIKALKELNIEILPKKFKNLIRMPRFFIRKILIKLLDSEFGRIALSSHAVAAKGEMEQLTDDLFDFIKNSKMDLIANRKLYALSFGN